ncbi:methyltransferase domain-containing protein [Streptomyces virginiae]|uniref:methyltransferase domain-containing protein n=1 Tax=Streptomyces virginiae TaxID=1961 RepID=UPI0036FBA035
MTPTDGHRTGGRPAADPLGPDDLRLTGVDHTDSMLAQARHRLGGRAQFRREDVLDMSLPPAFDAAYSVGVPPRLGAGRRERPAQAALQDPMSPVA